MKILGVNILVILFVKLSIETGPYHLRLHIVKFENRGGRCADEICNRGQGCCQSSSCAITSCRYTLSLCRIIPPKPLSYLRAKDETACQRGAIKTFQVGVKERYLSPITTTIFGSDLKRGIQIYFELRHNDSILIDRFAINGSEVGRSIGPTTEDGIFKVATITYNMLLKCRNPLCGQFCELDNNCTCLPGFTGTYCSEEIDDCKDVLCANSRMECIDHFESHECSCLPGFTGANCQNDLNECEVGPERCNFKGVCVNDLGSFHCECNEEYTGQFCENKLKKFAVEATFHSFLNPGGKCADIGDTCLNGNGCCDHAHCHVTTCDYMFLICWRGFGSPVSLWRTERRGHCSYLETSSHNSNVEDHFTTSIYGISNPIYYSLDVKPINLTELYIELVDSDEPIGNNELIDRFVIPITGNSSRTRYSGIFGLAEIELSISVITSDILHQAQVKNKTIINDVLEETLPSASTDRKVLFTTSISASEQNTNILIPVVSITSGIIATIIVIVSFLVFLWCYKNANNFHNRRHDSKTREIVQEIPVSKPIPALPNPRASEDLIIASPQVSVAEYSEISGSRSSQIYKVLEQDNKVDQDYQVLDHRNNSKMSASCSSPSPLQFDKVEPDYQVLDQDYQVLNHQNNSKMSASCSSPLPSQFDKVHQQDYNDYQAHRDSQNNHFEQTRAYSVRADDEYDYASEYWTPSSVEEELIIELKKLRIKTIPAAYLRETGALGSGAFGTVCKGVWKSRSGCEEEVAIKKIEDEASKEDMIHFLQEAAIMGQFNHPNILSIVGVVININKRMKNYQIVMELMSKGNLHSHLPSMKIRSQNILPSQLLSFSRQIASAMSYLATKGYIHRDLAARNVLLSHDETCKVADFGLSRDLQKESIYQSRGGMIPVKWTALESIMYCTWSSASDVWSYGCILYEIWSLGAKPFQKYSNKEAMQMISEGYRLPPPPGCPRMVYEIMIKCWNMDSEKRPLFSGILSSLHRPDYQVITWSPADQEKYTEHSRTVSGVLEDGKDLFLDLQNMYIS